MNKLLKEELTQTLISLVDIIGRMQEDNLRDAIAEVMPEEPKDNDPFTPDEAAAYLHCSRDNVYRIVRQKEIASFRVGRRIFIRKQQLDEWIAAGGSAAPVGNL